MVPLQLQGYLQMILHQPNTDRGGNNGAPCHMSYAMYNERQRWSVRYRLKGAATETATTLRQPLQSSLHKLPPQAAQIQLTETAKLTSASL